MRFLILFLSVAFLSCTNKGKTVPSSEEAKKKAEPMMAYNFSAKSISGENIELKNYLGRVVLINFWATWCPPCRAEIPSLIKLQEKYKLYLSIVGISVDQEGEEVLKKFARDYKLNYPVIMFTEEILKNYGGVSAIPTSFLVNHKGELIGKIVGYRSFEQFEEIILPYIQRITNESKD